MTGSAISDIALDRLRVRLDAGSSAPLVVAFSGGGDSLALLVLACEYGRETGRPVTALTVDHRLHPDSGVWTAAAGEAARRLGAGWRSLPWTGAKPVSGLPAAARQARHALLAQAARGLGARVILMGHTADDLAESAHMRRRDIPGLADPRPWSPAPVWPEGRGLFLLRPLLGDRRAALRERLETLGLRWLEDPANLDPRFARARARLAILGGAEAAARPDAGAERGAAAARRLAGTVRMTPEGFAVLPRALFRDWDAGEPADGLARVLGAAVVSVGGSAGPLRRRVLEALMDRLRGPDAARAQLAGVRLAAEGADVLLARDAREHRRAAPVATADVFDNRFETAPGVSIGWLAGRSARLDRGDRDRLRRIPALARPALPVLDPDGEAPRLPAPIGVAGPAVRALAPARFAAACGLVACEAEIV